MIKCYLCYLYTDLTDIMPLFCSLLGCKDKTTSILSLYWSILSCFSAILLSDIIQEIVIVLATTMCKSFEV